MAAKKLQGRGKLYDGRKYLCDARYEITSREITSGLNGKRLAIYGHLSGIVRDMLYHLEGKTWILHLEDGTQAHILVHWLNLSDVQNHRCQISVTTPL
jgi:hypothetical protein